MRTANPSKLGFIFAIVEATDTILRIVVVMVFDKAKANLTSADDQGGESHVF